MPGRERSATKSGNGLQKTSNTFSIWLLVIYLLFFYFSVVLVVSEETGALSLAYDSKLNYDLSLEEVRKILENLLEITSEAQVLEDTVDEHKTFA